MAVVGKAVHPDRWNPTTFLRKRGVVIHDSESADNSAQSLCDFMARPGDRPNDSGGFYGASYHAITTNDPKDVPYVQVQGADHGPFAAPPVNWNWWHICMPGRVNQGREGWLDEASRAGIRGVAQFIVDKSRIDSFELERCSVGDLLAGDGGYCGHVDIAGAWHQSNHTDPGTTFPWDVLAADITELIKPKDPVQSSGEDMEIAVLRMNNTVPKTDFLGYAQPVADSTGKIVNYKFWKVLWIDGTDPDAMKMYNDQLDGGALIHEFGEHVAVALYLENRKLPTSTHADGSPWHVTDWGYTNI